MKQEIKSKEYSYVLPQEQIAIHPLPARDHSKLLLLDQGNIAHHLFHELPQLLPSNASLFFNDTRVIPARLIFKKETGAQIEIFLLQPGHEDQPMQQAMEAIGGTTWKCTIGNLKKWKEGTVLQLQGYDINLTAKLKSPSQGLVEFNWLPQEITFAEIVNQFGNTPLPPYLNRKALETDKTNYQTIYAKYEGAVAAPTAGLHFTNEVLEKLKLNKMEINYLTLHVSAGTFQPIKTDNAIDHTMHTEQIMVTRENIKSLLVPNRQIIAVGTTSMRTLESLYWFGANLILEGPQPFNIQQTDPFKHPKRKLPSRNDAFQKVLTYMKDNDSLIGHTSIYMLPGYSFKVCDGLITNFHQPGSTLMLLVAAFVGPIWRNIYQQALDNKYRFLSYGDSSLLLPSKIVRHQI